MITNEVVLYNGKLYRLWSWHKPANWQAWLKYFGPHINHNLTASNYLSLLKRFGHTSVILYPVEDLEQRGDSIFAPIAKCQVTTQRVQRIRFE